MTVAGDATPDLSPVTSVDTSSDTSADTLPDVLSGVFEQIGVRGMVTGGFAVRGAWAAREPITRPFKLIALVAGSARFSVDGPGGPQGPVDLVAGDVVLLNHRTRLEVRGGLHDDGDDSDPHSNDRGQAQEVSAAATFDAMALAAADVSTDDVLVGGWIDINPAGQELLRTALPGLVHVHSASRAAPRLSATVQQIVEEVSSERLGSAFAIRQYGQLFLLEVLRAYLEQEEPPTGWFRLLADVELAPALRLMHDRPGHAWGLTELARAAGMSRTSFAERFRRVAGTPPLAYLTQWRMLLAQRAMRDPHVRVGDLAARLGYGSESAFSTAFKREVGEAPLHYRRRHLSADR